MQDVRVTNALYIHLDSKRPSEQMIKLEHDFAFIYVDKNTMVFLLTKRKLNNLTRTYGARAELEAELQEVFEPTVETLKSKWWVIVMVTSSQLRKQC